MTAVFFGEVAVRWLADGQPAAMIEKTKNQGRVRLAVTCPAIKALADWMPRFGARGAEIGPAMGMPEGWSPSLHLRGALNCGRALSASMVIRV
jgi:hypothetical protein